MLQEIFQSIATQTGAKTVFGEPLVSEGKVVLPVARVRFGFGGGTGHKAGREGFGGGAGVVAEPVGVVEVTRDTTRFVHAGNNGRWLAGLGIGLCLGLLMSKKRIAVKVDRTNR
jgi:uncharacterized spore protein YtfJ